MLQQAEPLPLGEGLWWLHSERQVRQPGLAFITPQQPLRYRDQPLNGLFCLASLGAAHEALLERLCEVLIEGRGQVLYQATSSRAVLEVLGGEVPHGLAQRTGRAGQSTWLACATGQGACTTGQRL